MNRKMFICIALVGLLLSFVYLPVVHATGSIPSVSDINMQIFNVFTVDIEPNAGASITFTNCAPNLESMLPISQPMGLDETSLQIIEEPPSLLIETYQIDSVTMSNHTSIYASVFNVTIFDINYSYCGHGGRVMAVKFEVSEADHRMFAISAISDHGEPAFSFLYYESPSNNILEGFGDWVHINGWHTLAEHYMYLSYVMTYAAQKVYTDSNNIHQSALKLAYKDMANYSERIAQELKNNPELSLFNKESQSSSALLVDPCWSGSGYWWARYFIKLALYSALVYAIYWAWTLIFNPGTGALILAILIPALWAYGQLVVPVVVDMFTMALRIWAPSWGWFSWVPEGIAWAVENAASLAGFAVFTYKAIVYQFWPYVAGLFWTCLWWYVDAVVEYVFDYLWWFRDY
jgi:hypothetical protein